jgi:AP-1 complex subunit mu
MKCCLCLEQFKVGLGFRHGLLFYLQVKPLIWIESVIERHAHSRVEYMIKAKSQFKRRSTANNVEIVIPVPADADSPKFKTTIGSVKYAPEQNAITWTVKSFPVSYHCSYVDHTELLCIEGWFPRLHVLRWKPWFS